MSPRHALSAAATALLGAAALAQVATAASTSASVRAAGGTRLVRPAQQLSCGAFSKGVIVGVRFQVNGSARAVRVQLRKPNSTLHYAETTFRPTTAVLQKQALHGRGCGRSYEIRYTVLTGAAGSKQDTTHHVPVYKLTVAASTG